MFKALLIFIAMITSCTAFSQQTVSITGRVTDKGGQPLPYTNVFIEELGIGAVADKSGFFELEKVPSGVHKIIAKVLGFKVQVRAVTVNGESLSDIDFRLEEQAENLDEVVIQAKSEAQTLRASAQAVKVVETKQVKLKTADFGEVLARTEGISVQRAGGLGSTTRFALNGLSGDQVRFFYNDVPLRFSPYTFGIANIPVNQIDRAEVYKGVVPIRFGADALGGGVNLVSPEIFDGLSGSGSYHVGSFNTHRITANLSFADKATGFYVTTGGFYDYTDNNYKIDVALPDEQGQLSQETVRRFHDAYKALGANMRIGIRGKKWANQMEIEGYYGEFENEIQNSQSPGLVDQPRFGISNAVGGNPFGGLLFSSFSTGLNLRYNLELSNWDFDLTAGYNYDERESFDVSNNLYNWLGEVIRVQPEAGEFGAADNLVTTTNSLFARNQISYNLNDDHTVALSLAPTYSKRTGDDLLVDGPEDPALAENFLFDFVSGIEYTGNFANDRLQAIGFAKNYMQDIRIETFAPDLNRTLVDERQVSNYGAGTGIRYKWSPRLLTKISYEFAYRLPRQDEIFGDGLQILENLDLEPENSHNLNFQWSLDSSDKSDTFWKIDGNLFLRRIDNLIFFSLVFEDFGTFENVWSATSQGIELAATVNNLIPRLNLAVNSTYQAYINTSDVGQFARFNGDRIPNVPYLFANVNADYTFKQVFNENDNLNVFWNSRFVDAFFIGWESFGSSQFKQEVPRQLVHGSGITHKLNFKDFQLATTLEVANLTNAKVFDFFGLQRPGRAFYFKTTIQF